MRHSPVFAVSLAFQRSFPHVLDRARDLQTRRKKGESEKLSWPAWCGFPVGLAYDVLRCYYGYERDGVEPFLLAALAGWRLDKQVLRLDAARFEEACCLPELDVTPLTGLYTLPWSCLYLEYPDTAGALGAFIFLDYNGDEQKHLVFLLQLEMYRVEPVLLPLTPQHETFGHITRDYLNCCARHRESGEQARFFRKAMALCSVNLGMLQRVCGCETAAVRPGRLN